jgi:hypothetical protein
MHLARRTPTDRSSVSRWGRGTFSSSTETPGVFGCTCYSISMTRSLLATLALLLTCCSTPITLTERAAPAPAEREPYHPALTIRTGGEGYACPEEMVEDLYEAADRWCEYTSGDFCPQLTTSDSHGEITCRDNEGRAGSTAVYCPSGSEPINVYTCKTDDGEKVPTRLRMQFRMWAMSGPAARRVAIHELGHAYDFLGRVSFPEANGHGHTDNGIMSTSASGWAMPAVEYD